MYDELQVAHERFIAQPDLFWPLLLTNLNVRHPLEATISAGIVLPEKFPNNGAEVLEPSYTDKTSFPACVLKAEKFTIIQPEVAQKVIV